MKKTPYMMRKKRTVKPPAPRPAPLSDLATGVLNSFTAELSRLKQSERRRVVNALHALYGDVKR